MNIYKKHSNENPLYKLWKSTRQKCQNPSNKSYKSFGGKGIFFYDDWNDFDVFSDWALDNDYTKGKTIELIDKNASFSPENCFFSSRFQHHGMSQSRLYKEWRGMLLRCTTPSHKSYKDYGGRGISVCTQWHEFPNFQEWALANGYNDNLTIDRIDVNGNYEPSNCRFTDIITQCNNRRSSKFITYQGKTMSQAQWARELGISRGIITQRAKRNLPVNEILRTEKHAHRGEKHRQNLITFNGITMNQKQWAERVGVSPTTLGRRLKEWGIERALTQPPR
jgi:DNA-binding XRE family transcriptional regulator